MHQALSSSDLDHLIAAMTTERTDAERLDLLRRQSVIYFFSTEHVCTILKQFSISHCQVEAAVILHPRVIDLEHYLKALMLLLRNGGRPKQYAEGNVPSMEDDCQILQILRRIGWLNIWNPMDPDVMYRYNVSIIYDRQRICTFYVVKYVPYGALYFGLLVWQTRPLQRG